MTAVHPELTSARWLPRSVFPRQLRLLYRLVEMLQGWRSGECQLLEGGGEAWIYRPKDPPAEPGPGVLWIHGGGLVMGHAAQDGGTCQALADELGAVVVSAQYRLVPEHSFPIPVEDCFRALQALAALPEVDASRLAVAGQSAGGGLSAAVALLARQRGVPLRFQALLYPMLDDRSSDRVHANSDGFRGWNASSNRYGWSNYLASVEPDDIPEAAVPGRARDLAELPPAWVGVGTLDLFLDEDVAYAKQLQDAGVACELLVVEGAHHGFDVTHSASEVAGAFRQSWVGALRGALFETHTQP